MDRDISNHPTAAQIMSGEPLTDEQLASLTPEQREQLIGGSAPAPAELPGNEYVEGGVSDDVERLAELPPLADDDVEIEHEELDGDVDDDELPPGADNGFVA